MKLSIVTTLYKSAPYIEEFVSRAMTTAEALAEEVELIVVDDGSPDDALNKVVKQKEQFGNLKVIQLSRNFGHHEAILTGLKYADGDYVFLMDCDLEENPEDLQMFHDRMRENPDADVVFGIQTKRHKGLLDRLFGRLYYWMFNFLSDIRIPENLATTRLMTRAYVDALLQYDEVDALLSGLWASTGFNQLPIEVDKKYKGDSSYNLARQINLVVRSITSFSAKPLVYIFYVGVIISLIAFIAILWFVYQKIFHDVGVSGWTSLFVSLWFIGGLLILSIGVVGVYIERIFRQVKQRPRSIVKKIY